MHERTKKLLTKEVIREEYNNHFLAFSQFCKKSIFWYSVALGALFLLIIKDSSARVLLWFCCAPLALLLFTVASLLKLKKQSKFTDEDLEIVEDIVVNKDFDTGENEYYRVDFAKSGKLYVGCDFYAEAETGDLYYAVKIRGKFTSLVFPKNKWRLHNMLPEEIEKELREEDELMVQLISCERFPKLTDYKENVHSNSSRKERKKPEEQNILERFAEKYFSGNITQAMEYILLYCPETLQNEALQGLSKSQLNLCKAMINRIQQERHDERKRR